MHLLYARLSRWMISCLSTMIVYLSLGVSQSVMASEIYSFYYGLSWGGVQYQNTSLPSTARMTSGYGRLGKYVNEWMALEGRLGFGTTSDEQSDGRDQIKVVYDNSVGLYSKLHAGWMDAIGPYALLGFSRVEVTEQRQIFFPVPYDATGISLGFGVDILLYDWVSMNLEWIQLVKKDGFSADVLQIGFSTYY